MDSPLVELVVKVLGCVALLVAPIVVYSWIDRRLTQRAVDSIGKIWCEDNGKAFVRVERWKNHFALIYQDRGSKARRKFVARFRPLTWSVYDVTWLTR